MTDKQLVAEIARVWVENGGDSDGFIFSISRIKEAIKELEGKPLIESDEEDEE